jgi:hypothetical protein
MLPVKLFQLADVEPTTRFLYGEGGASDLSLET